MAIVYLAFLLALILARADQTATTDIPSDYQVYVNATNDILAHRDPYPSTPWLDDSYPYHYAPPYAILLSPFFQLPYQTGYLLTVILNIIAYCAATPLWLSLFRKAGYHTLPIAFCLLSDLWAAKTYFGNIAALLIFCSAIVCHAILSKKPLTTALYSLPLLLTKPQYLFPLALLFVTPDRRFFTRSITLILTLYSATYLISALFIPHQIASDTLHYLTTLLSSQATPAVTPPNAPLLNNAFNAILRHYLPTQTSAISWIVKLYDLMLLLMLTQLGLRAHRSQQLNHKIALLTSTYLVLTLIASYITEITFAPLIFAFLPITRYRWPLILTFTPVAFSSLFNLIFKQPVPFPLTFLSLNLMLATLYASNRADHANTSTSPTTS